MTTQPGDEGNAPEEHQEDPDADPMNMNPRSGAAASSEATESDEYEDTDADPANLNPRTTMDEPET